MSCAPPPPPPPGPAIACFANKSNSPSGGDGRSMLLDSIRKGKTLKKTVTNDKSAPVLGGSTAVRSSTSGNGSSTLRTNANSRLSMSNDPPPPTAGLGGLFAHGIPTLKKTGLPIGQAYQQYRNEIDAPKSNSSVNSRLSSYKVQNTHRSNGNNDSSSGYHNHHSTSSITKVRGPPPQPPGPPPKLINRDPDTANGLVVHARSTSTVSLSENSYQNRVPEDGHHPVHSYGKPSLAPKPPSSIARAQSMRVPKSSISVNEINKNESQYGEPDQSEAYRMMNKKNGFPSFHQSQESLSRRNTRSSSPTRIPSNAVSWGSSLNTGSATLRMYHRSHGSPRHPSTKPPPPPSKGTAMSPPMCPPPPPPVQAPLPPPHRLLPAPPPPSVVKNKPITNLNAGTPPKPPARHSSMKSSNSNQMSPFDMRFFAYFHNVEEFPSPQPFQHVKKIYNSKIQGKQQAPKPPISALHQQNRSWQSSETTSKC